MKEKTFSLLFARIIACWQRTFKGSTPTVEWLLDMDDFFSLVYNLVYTSLSFTVDNSVFLNPGNGFLALMFDIWQAILS